MNKHFVKPETLFTSSDQIHEEIKQIKVYPNLRELAYAKSLERHKEKLAWTTWRPAQLEHLNPSLKSIALLSPLTVIKADSVLQRDPIQTTTWWFSERRKFWKDYKIPTHFKERKFSNPSTKTSF